MQLCIHLKCKVCVSAVICGLLLFSSQALSAETFEEHRARLIKDNPEGLSLTISVDKNTYFLGEIIPITLTFSNNSDIEYYVETRAHDRSGRLHDITFYVDGPSGGYSDPLETHSWGIGGGLSGGPERLGQYSQVFTLNEWIRFDIPGDYRIYCTTTRVWARNDRSRQIINLCSQIIKIKLRPANKVFIAETVSKALENLKSEDREIRRNSVRTLRFLAVPESVEAIVGILGDPMGQLCYQAYFGIIGSRDWPHARKTLYGRIADPDIVVNYYYVRALVHISLQRQKHIIFWDPNNIEASRKRHVDLDAKKKEIENTVLQYLASVLSKKRDRALAVACSLLLEREFEAPGLKQRLAKSFLYLTEDEQEELLKYHWEQARCAELESVVRKIIETGPEHKEWRYPGIFSRMLLRYKEFEPEKARALIINDIKQPCPLLADEALLSLPDESLPEVEDVLVRNLLARRESSPFKVPLLIERYATARVLPEIIKFYKKNKGKWACSIQDRLLRYWVKHERPNGLAAVVEAVGLREHTRCYTSVLGHVLSAHYGPDAEKIAISFVDDKEPDVVVDVVRLLRRKGTINCVDPLLAKLAALDPKKKEQILPGAAFSDVSVYHDIVDCLMYNDRWQLSNEQKQLLKQHLRTDRERQIYQRRFEPKQKTE